MTYIIKPDTPDTDPAGHYQHSRQRKALPVFDQALLAAAEMLIGESTHAVRVTGVMMDRESVATILRAEVAKRVGKIPQ